MKRLKRFIWNWIAKRNLKNMKAEALRLHEQTGKRYLVVPVSDWKRGEYVIVNNEAHKEYNKQAKKMGQPQIPFIDLVKSAAYVTPVGRLN